MGSSTPSSSVFDTLGHVSAVNPRGMATTPRRLAACRLLWGPWVGSAPCMAMSLRGTIHPFPKRNPLSAIARL